LVIGLAKLCDGDLERLRGQLRDPTAEEPSALAADVAELRTRSLTWA